MGMRLNLDFCDGPWSDWWSWPAEVPCPTCGQPKIAHDLDRYGRWWLDELEHTDELNELDIEHA